MRWEDQPLRWTDLTRTGRAVAVTVLCAAALLIVWAADTIGQDRRCANLTPGTATHTYYCEEQ